jgi:hypothetical protein
MARIKKVSFIFLIIISCNQTTERNCTKFYTGKYFSETIIDGVQYKSTFRRDTSGLQIEEFKGIIDSSEVRWINDCEMVLSTINPKNNTDKKNILIKILETTDTSYTYEYSYLGEAKKVKASAFKIGN